MKHLISLSLKYIKRQKLRSTLTFLCITLSVFILGVCGSFFSSILTTMKNEEIKNYGSWEVDLSKVMNACDDSDIETKYQSSAEAAQIAAKHPAISDFYYQFFHSLNGNLFRDENNGGVTYFDITLDNGELYRTSGIRQNIFYGNDELMGSNYYAYGSVKEYKTDKSVILPDVFMDYGYEVGDEITMTITPVWGMVDVECEAVTETLDKIRAENARGKTFYYVGDGPELPQEETEYNSYSSGPLIMQLMKFGCSLSDVEFFKEKRGSSVTYQFVIDGFSESGIYSGTEMALQTPVTTDLNFDKLYEDNAVILGEGYDYSVYGSMDVRTSDNIEFEDAVEMFYKDLGMPEGEFYNYIEPTEDFHNELLALELKGADAVMTLIPLIIIGLFVAFIAWAISRFVIDNAFEISVQERSAQFAALRIMGAAKNQLLALIFTEATCYCFTAVPIGMVTAFLLCKSAVTSMRAAGFSSFEFSINPAITIICIALCISAIYISAYTSAMWAARKLSPSEALNYGKPVRKKRRFFPAKQYKSKSYRSSGRFIVSYTFKNIFRTKKRFLISTIAMALGVLLFSFCSMLGFYAGGILKNEFSSDGYDYAIESYSAVNIEEAVETFGNNELFSSFRINLNSQYVPETQTDSDTLQAFFPYENKSSQYNHNFYAIDRTAYEKYAEALTGISYDEFIESEAVIIAASPYGDQPTWDENGPVRLYDNGYKAYTELGFSEIPTVRFKMDYTNSIYIEPEDNPYVTLKVMGTITFEHNFTSIILPIENLTKMFTDFSNPLLYYNIMLTVADNTVYEEAQDVVDNWQHTSETTLGIEENYMMYTGMRSLIMAIIKTMLIVLIAIWLTGILSMVNSINTSVLNRQQELLMMRSVGMSRRQLLGTVIIESLLFSSVSTIIGLILGTVSFVFTILVVFGEVYTTSITINIISVVTATLIINVIIAALAAIPGVKSLSKSINQHRM